MTGANLARLLRPRSVALFGGTWAENVLLQLQKSGYAGSVWPVHPRRTTMAGVACFATVDQLPDAPDASFIGVNRTLTVDIVSVLSALGAGGAVCFAAGFSEHGADGGEWQTRLVNAAGSMPILGPNCYGLLNYLDGIALWPDQHGGRAVEQGVAIISQSSNIAISMTMQRRGLPLAYMLTAGNQAQTSIGAMASALLDDDRVTALGLYIEGFGDLRGFEAMALKARAKGKPVVALKIGKSPQGRASALSHTASLAGDHAGAAALLRRLDIVEVASVAVLLETLKLMHYDGPLSGNAIASVSCSGGEAALVSDCSIGISLNLRPFSEIPIARLRAVLGTRVAIANPLDYNTFIWGDREKMRACFCAVADDGFDLVVFILDVPRADRCDVTGWDCAIEAIIEAKRQTGARIAVLATLPENMPENLADRFGSAGIAPLAGIDAGLAAIDAAIAAGERIAGASVTQPLLIVEATRGCERVLSEFDAKTALAAFGLSVPKAVRGASIGELLARASRLQYPCALKGLGVAHKSDAGAVALGLVSVADVSRAAADMAGCAQGFLLEEMVNDAIAEVLIGVTRDATGLLVLTLGYGGVLTELIDDSASLLLPASRADIETTLRSLKISRLIDGFRGRPPGDEIALIDAIEAVSNYANANQERLIELEVNPLIVRGTGAVAVDALIRLSN